MIVQSHRLTLQKLVTQNFSLSEADQLRQTLSQNQKTIPPQYFYDDRGSQLFEQICLQPEYYLTRTEIKLLQTVAPLLTDYTKSCELVELGSGSSRKTNIILDAYQSQELPLKYTPIDISSSILELSANNLLQVYPRLEVHGIVATYEEALAHLPPTSLPRRLIYFLGSSLGNLDPKQCDIFFTQLANGLQAGDYFLLGIDLHKDHQVLEAAYNDAQGITAQFNLNILTHLNRRFGANFNPDRFRPIAQYNPINYQIEMYLESTIGQDVYIQGLDLSLHFFTGERILTEISRKFNLIQISQELTTKGFKLIETWQDDRGWFGLVLVQKN